MPGLRDLCAAIARPATPALRRPRSSRALGLTTLLAMLLVAPLGGAQEAESAAETPEAPASAVSVALAQFTTAVENREPVDQITFVANDVRKVFFYSDLRGLAGQTVSHRWLYGGEQMASVSFEVRGPRWRVWSSKSLLPDWIGDWTVEIVAEDGQVLAAETFTYSAPDA